MATAGGRHGHRCLYPKSQAYLISLSPRMPIRCSVVPLQSTSRRLFGARADTRTPSAGRTRQMARHELRCRKPYRPRPPIGIVPLEIERALAFDDFAAGVDHKSMDARQLRRPYVEDHTVPCPALLVTQPGAALHPLLRQTLLCQRPSKKSLDLLMLIDDEIIMTAIDLTDETVTTRRMPVWRRPASFADIRRRDQAPSPDVAGAKRSIQFRRPRSLERASAGGPFPQAGPAHSLAPRRRASEPASWRSRRRVRVNMKGLPHCGLGAFDRALPEAGDAALHPSLRPARCLL